MAKNSMEFSGHGSEIEERSTHSIEGLVTSGFIDESGQLTERTRRAIPRGGVEVLTPVRIQRSGESTYLDLNHSKEMQEPYRVVADRVLLGGCFTSDLYLQAERNDRIFKQGYITICQDPVLVDIMRQLEGTTQNDRHTKPTLRDIGTLGTIGLGSFITGSGASLLSSGEPLLSAAGIMVGGAVSTLGTQLAEAKWLEKQVMCFSQAVHSCSDNINH